MFAHIAQYSPINYGPHIRPIFAQNGPIYGPIFAHYGPHIRPILDQYRVQSLYKILLETPLTPPQRQEAKEVLRKKLEIVLNGAKKRGRNDIITRIEKIKWNLLALQLF